MSETREDRLPAKLTDALYGQETAAQLRADRDALTSQVTTLQGAMAAQDERQRVAGECCGVSAVLHGCDWPEYVAEAVEQLTERVATLTAEVERLTQERNEARANGSAVAHEGWYASQRVAEAAMDSSRCALKEKREIIATVTARAEAAEAALRTVQHAAKTLVAGADARVASATAHEPAARIAIATLDSERAMNAQLTAQLEAAEARVTALEAVLRRFLPTHTACICGACGQCIASAALTGGQ